jgi:pyridoxal 5'-phosphate synthase pdxT subunit
VRCPARVRRSQTGIRHLRRRHIDGSGSHQPVEVERNAYGRQIDSRVAEIDIGEEFVERTAPGKLEAVFIRAPIIRRVGPDVRVLVSYHGDPVLVEQGRYLAATFHPELTPDPRVHTLFLEKL